MDALSYHTCAVNLDDAHLWNQIILFHFVLLLFVVAFDPMLLNYYFTAMDDIDAALGLVQTLTSDVVDHAITSSIFYLTLFFLLCYYNFIKEHKNEKSFIYNNYGSSYFFSYG